MRIARIVSRLMIFEPIAAWTGTSNIWRDQLLQLLDQRLALAVGVRAVDDEAQRVDWLAADEDVELDEVARPVADVRVVEAGVPARSALQLVVEVDDQLAERHLEVEVHPLRVEVLHVLELAAAARSPAP